MGWFLCFVAGSSCLSGKPGSIFENSKKTQLQDGLFGLEENDFRKVVIAYEPVWAIGTGKNSHP
jgi:triosephosphate isomerase (TIM)